MSTAFGSSASRPLTFQPRTKRMKAPMARVIALPIRGVLSVTCGLLYLAIVLLRSALPSWTEFRANGTQIPYLRRRHRIRRLKSALNSVMTANIIFGEFNAICDTVIH